MFKIAIVEKIHDEGLKLLDKHPNFEYTIIDEVSKNNLIKELPKFDGLTLRVAKLDSEILKHCKKLKVVSRHGVGYDNVDIKALKENNITLLITATGNAVTVAEHAMYMMLSLAKGIVSYDKAVRSGDFKKYVSKIETYELFNKEILIAGFGRIGKNLIKRCLGFEMRVNVYDPFVSKEIINSYGGNKIENLNNSIKTADFISVHMPLNKETKNLINLKMLKTMKKNTIIINTARGGVINEIDLNQAINEKIIFGAGLDVFEKEPPDQNNPLLKNKRVLLSPHSSSFTNECKIRMSLETTQNIIDFFENNIKNSMKVKL
ncbi:MAG: hydroxyacid dehydrogenase [Candidatus Marinimicrobia bacterium]|nr:hydroxyacid dehydrogenase [Candidatus Neomarinimicrobiota bacterium]|tara:strand:- start:1403 stop:2359 length:957 start_codon:yes stop_codon:yes gene_type:complete